MKISIIMPVYNNEKKLHISVESVLKQNYSNWELIIVNDGSTDSTADIIDNYASIDKRIKVSHRENSGPSAARNFGVEKATGEYFIFIDSDDYLEVYSLKELATIANQEKFDFIIYGYYDRWLSNDNYILKNEKVTARKVYSSNNEFKEDYAYYDDTGYTHPIWNKMYNLDFIKENNIEHPTDVFNSGDFIFNLQIFEIANHILVMDQPLYNYVNSTEGSIASSFKLTKIDSYEKNYLKAYEIINRWNPYIVNRINNEFIRNISVYINSLYFDDCDLSRSEKREVVKEIVNRKTVRESLSEVSPVSLRIKIITFLLKTKNIDLLLTTGKFTRKVRNI